MIRTMLSLAVVAGVAWAPVPGYACSWRGTAITSSLPASGAEDVPVDVAPLIRGYWDRESLVWETLDGRAVEFDLSSGPSADFTQGNAGELKPRRPLEPNTSYVIRAGSTIAGEFARQVEFTTGSHTTEESELSAPPLDAIVVTHAGNGCAPGEIRGCLGSGDDILLEIVDAKDTILTRDVTSGNVTVWPIQQPQCIRAFRRDAAGRVSPATELCSPQLSFRRARQHEHRSSCDDDVGSRADAGADDEGVEDHRFFCSATAPGRSHGDRWILCGTLWMLGSWSVRRTLRRHPRKLSK